MIKAISYIFCYLVYPFSFLFPRSRKRWAFGSFRGAFNDNAKYLFIYCNENNPEINCAWISKKRKTVRDVRALGLKAYWIADPRGAFFALTSKYWFFNAYTSDIMFCLSGGATCINLWHGVGLKRIEFNSVSGPMADRFVKKKFKEVFFHPESFRRPDFLVTASDSQTEMFSKAFRIPESSCLKVGYPRNSILLRPEEEIVEFVNRYESEETKSLLKELKTFRKIYIYMPTWRDSQREIFVQNMDLGKLNVILSDNGDLLLLKPHANTIVNDMMSGYSNIRLLPSGMDTYPLLPFTDCLITDYSSILYDYILMVGKSVVLYLYDYSSYVKERDFYYPFDDNVVGEKVYEFDTLAATIRAGAPPVDSSKRDILLARFWGNPFENDACLRISEYAKSRK